MCGALTIPRYWLRRSSPALRSSSPRTRISPWRIWRPGTSKRNTPTTLSWTRSTSMTGWCGPASSRSLARIRTHLKRSRMSLGSWSGPGSSGPRRHCGALHLPLRTFGARHLPDPAGAPDPYRPPGGHRPAAAARRSRWPPAFSGPDSPVAGSRQDGAVTDELPRAELAQASPVTLASLNLHGGLTSHGEPFDVAGACHRLKADVITLQEAWRPEAEPDVVTSVAAALGAEVRHRGLARATSRARLGLGTDRGAGTWGLAVLSMLPVTGYQEVELGRAPGDQIGRAAQVLTLATPGGAALRVVNTHLTHRYSSPVQLALLVRRLAGSSLAAV